MALDSNVSPGRMISYGVIEFVGIDGIDLLGFVVLHHLVAEVVAPQYLVWPVGSSNLKDSL